MKRFRAHTHLVYLLCVHSLHMSHVTLAHYCFMLLCVHVSCNLFPVVVRKRPRMHLGCLFLREDRRWRMPLASPLVSPFLVKRRFGSAAWPPNETAEFDQRLLDLFCGSDRWFLTAERNRRSHLIDLFSRVDRRFRNRRMKLLMCHVLVRSHSAVRSAVSDRRMKPPKFPCI